MLQDIQGEMIYKFLNCGRKAGFGNFRMMAILWWLKVVIVRSSLVRAWLEKKAAMSVTSVGTMTPVRGLGSSQHRAGQGCCWGRRGGDVESQTTVV